MPAKPLTVTTRYAILHQPTMTVCTHQNPAARNEHTIETFAARFDAAQAIVARTNKTNKAEYSIILLTMAV